MLGHAWRSQIPLTILAILLAGAGSAQAQTTVLYLDSQPGDPVGQGLQRTFTTSEVDFSVYQATAGSVSIRLQIPGSFSTLWRLDFESPSGSTLAPGTYDAWYRVSRSPLVPGFSISGPGFCSAPVGRFQVHEIVFDGSGTLERFAVDFEHHCGDVGPALIGALRFNSTYTSVDPFGGDYPVYALSIAPPLHGSVVGPGISCGGGAADCDERYGSARDVLLEAAPRLGHAQAIGAIAHRLCRLIWKILHQGIRYEERGPAVNAQSQQARTRKMIRELRGLGYRVALASTDATV